MKLSKFAFLILTGLFLTFSCVSQDDIKNLQNQIDTIKDSEISSINKQLKSITTSLTDLEKADAGLKTYIDNLTETSRSSTRPSRTMIPSSKLPRPSSTRRLPMPRKKQLTTIPR